MLPQIKPITPLRIQKPFDDPEFIAELKHDGFRALAYIESSTARLISRKDVQYKSKPFVSLCALLAKLPVRDAILDGELICLDGDGRSQFMDLMRRRRQDVCYYAFDLLWLSPAARARLNRAVKGAACGAANTPPPSGPEGAGQGASRAAQGAAACQNQ